MRDAFHLQRFVEAQADRYEEVLSELHSGQKQSHWMWFIFPQIRGLGHSATARHFAISSLDEARAFLAHSVLGPRFRECTALVHQIQNRTVERIFGFPDHLKFRSSITLFHQASPLDSGDQQLFQAALDKYFAGQPDPLTLSLIKV